MLRCHITTKHVRRQNCASRTTQSLFHDLAKGQTVRTKAQEDRLYEWLAWGVAVFVIVGFFAMLFLFAKFIFWLADEYEPVAAALGLACVAVIVTAASRDN